MLRINRSRFVGLLCLAILIYVFLFTDSDSATSGFRANTEAGMARKASSQLDLPLRGRLSDEDLTKKTNEELQGILDASQSKEKFNKDGSYREPQHGRPVAPSEERFREDGTYRGKISKEELQKEGQTREEPGAWKKVKQEVEEEAQAVAEVVSGKVKVPGEKPKYPTEQKALEGEDDGTETGGGPGKDFAREKLSEYLKNPGKLACMSLEEVARLNLFSRNILEIVLSSLETSQASPTRRVQYRPKTNGSRARLDERAYSVIERGR